MVGTLLLLVVPPALLARRGDPPKSRTVTSLPVESIAVVQLNLVDATVLLAEDAQASKPGPLRFAVPVEVDITPQTAGTWEQLPDGARLWRLRFYSPGATDLNFGFGRYGLPDGATLHVYSESEDYYEGPYTYRDNRPQSQLWLPVVPGDRAIVELYLPFEYNEEPELRLTHVGTGYRDLFGRLGGANLKQGSCNIDVICPEADPWRDEIKSVARYSIGGTSLCTGSLMMDVPRSFRHFFLSAAHCGVNGSNDSTLVFYWNYESPNCGDLSGGSLADNQTGATFRASKEDVDMLLVELDEDPASFGVYYSGWDRSGSAPAGSVGIHHPDGDEKAISFNTTLLTTVNSCIGAGNSTHWLVDDWEQGTTEVGSSGSGLWDPATKRMVGFLSGGSASCSQPFASDCYGKFSVAWDSGSAAASRLKDWLDPLDQGDLMVDGAYPGCEYGVGQGTSGSELTQFQNAHITAGGEAVLGCPVGQVRTDGFVSFQGTQGHFQNFVNGSIEYHANGPNQGSAFAVVNPLYDKWKLLGFTPLNPLGYPIGNLSNVSSSCFGTPLKFQPFEGGALECHWNGAGCSALYEVHGAIYTKWGQKGFAVCPLGLPTSDERDALPSPQGTTGRVSDFEGGHIHWSTGAPEAYETHGSIDSRYVEMGGTPSWLGFPTTVRLKVE